MKFKVGDRVRIKKGSWRGQRGHIESIDKIDYSPLTIKLINDIRIYCTESELELLPDPFELWE